MKYYYVTESHLESTIEEEGISSDWNNEIAIFNHIEKAHFFALHVEGLYDYLIYEINNLGITGELEYWVHKYFPLANYYSPHQFNIAPQYIELIRHYFVDDSFEDMEWFKFN